MTPELPNIPLEPALRFTTELVLISAGLWFMLGRLGAARHLAALGRRRMGIVAVFIGAWVLVQLTDRLHLHYPQEASYYPLTRFAMYERGLPADTTASYYLEGEYADGTSAELDLAEWFPSVEATALDNRMVTLARWLRAANDPSDVKRAEWEVTGYVFGLRSTIAESGRPVPLTVSLHATSRRISDRAVVSDTVVWRAAIENPPR